MLLALWILVGAGFWLAYSWLTRGAPLRHLAFLHFTVYFFAIYLNSYAFYAANGASNTRFIMSVMAYPALALVGMWLAQFTFPKAEYVGAACRLIAREKTMVIVLFAFFMTFYVVYLRSLGDNIPLLVLVRGAEPVESRLARFLATKGYEGAMGGLRLFFWLPRVLIDYLASFMIVFAYYWAREKKGNYLAFTAVTSLLVLLSVLQVEKLPAIRLAVVLALCHFNYANRRIGLKSLRTASIILMVSVVFAGAVYSVVSGAFRDMGAGSALTRLRTTAALGQELLGERGQIGQLTPLYYTYELVPKTYDHFGGRTLTNPHGIFPYQRVVWPFLLFEYKNTTDPGVTGSDPTVFFGEIYANWGLAFSFLMMLVFGYLLQVLNDKLARDVDRIGSAFDFAFFYLICVYLMDFALGFTTPWFDERIYIFVAMYLFRKHILLRRETIAPTQVPALP